MVSLTRESARLTLPQPRSTTVTPPQRFNPSPLESGATLTVDLQAIVANWRMLAAGVGTARCAAVVKADAYGCGIEEVVPALAAAGADTFFVAHGSEGIRARAVAPDATIYVLNGLPPGASVTMLAGGLLPVLGSMAEIEEWAQQGEGGAAALHIDTGMNRLGLNLEEAAVVAKRHAQAQLGFQPSLIMSHLACADEPESPLNAIQLARFRAVRALFPDVAASLANSAATHQSGDWCFDLCRPGIALYGGTPYASLPNPMLPVVSLASRIIQLRDAAAGETVGYGARQRLTRPTRLAILSTGYADGYLRLAGSSDDRSGAEAIVNGKRCPLVGRVSMDLIAIDVTEAGALTRGDYACLIGQGITVDEVAAHAETIGYEVLTSLGKRYHRVYVRA